MNWVSKYIGIPYKDYASGPDEYDCWGLFVLVYKNEFGIDVNVGLPDYFNDDDKISRFPITMNNWIRVDKPEIGDGVLCMVMGKLPHCGIYIGNGKMLHTIKGISSCIERLSTAKWKSRFEGYYRHSSSFS